MRRSLWAILLVAVIVSLPSLALAQGRGNDNGNGGGGGGGGGDNGGGNGNGGGGGPPPETPAPASSPQPEPEPAPAPSPAPQEPAPTQTSTTTTTSSDTGSGGGASAGSSAGGAEGAGSGAAQSQGAAAENPNAGGGNANAHQGNENAAGAVAQTGENANAQGGNELAGGGNANAGGNFSQASDPPSNGTRGNSDARRAGGDEDEPGERGRGADKRNESANGEHGKGRDDAPGQDRREQTPADGFSGGGAGGNGVGADGTPPAQVPDEALERSSVPEENTRSAIVRVQQPDASDDRALDVAQGDVLVSSEGVENETTAFVVLIHPNGTEEILAEGTTEAPWNTTSYQNGYYRVEVRERTSSGEIVTVASTQILVENPRAEVVAAVAAVATSAALSAGAGVLATRSFDLLGMLKMAGGEAATEAATQKVEDKLRTKTASVAAMRWRARSTLLLLAAAGMLAFFKAFAAKDDLLLTLPIAFFATFVYCVGDYAAEWSLARASGASTQFKLWTPGALSLAVSSVLFRSPFGYPGYVSETDVGNQGEGNALRARAGYRALAFLGAGVALVLPFLLLGRLWRWEVAEYGVGVALMMSAAASMPFSPMPGKDVWRWSRVIWIGAFGLLATLYVLWQIALLPMLALVGVAFAGAIGFAAALRFLRPRA